MRGNRKLLAGAAIALAQVGTLIGVAAGPASAAGPTSAALGPVRYRFVELLPPGTPPGESGGYTQTFGNDLNEGNVVTGISGPLSRPPAVRWSPAATEVLPGAVPGFGWVWAEGINEAGDVAGHGYVDRYSPPHAFVYRNGSTQDLGSGAARAINDGGQVVGVRNNANLVREAVLWQDGRTVRLGTLGGTTSSKYGTNSTANDINNAGHIVGAARSAKHPALRGYVRRNGVMTDLGTLGGTGEATEAFAVNDRTQIVGMSQNAQQETHAFLWENGRMRDLGTFGGDLSAANDINNTGTVVGVARYYSDRLWQRAFVWRDGVMTDLNTVVEGLPAGVILENAHALNDSGAIVASSCRNPGDIEICEPGATAPGRSYLLLPIS